MKSKIYLLAFALALLGFNNPINSQNIALAKNVTASTAVFGNLSSFINDGKGTGAQLDGLGGCISGTCSRWESGYSDPQWIYIDLATQYNLTSVTLNWEFASGKDFTIDVSNDAITWTPAATITGNAAFINNIPISATGRYVRMNGTARNNMGAGYSLWEFEIYGTIVTPLGLNRALNRPGTASSEILFANNAFDGQGNAANVDYIGNCSGGPGCTFWASNNNNPEWIYVDLGGAYNLRQAILYWTFKNSRDFVLETSPDSFIWTPVPGTSMTGNTAFANTFDLTGATGRYLRMYATANNAGGHELFEFEVYSTGFILPVSILDFKVLKLQNGTSKIYWSTSQEQDSKNFVIQRSGDGISWQNLTTVPANGNSNSQLNYSFVDNSPLKGLNLYRLKIVDIDDKFSYSDIRKVNFSSKNLISLYPNPVSDVLKITSDGNDELRLERIEVLNSQNQVLINNKVKSAIQPFEINVTSLKAGIYFLRIILQDGSVSMEKFIKK